MSVEAGTRTADSQVASALALSAGAQLIAKAVHLALNIVASLALIRYLGPAGYGDYVFVISLSAMFGLISDFGLAKVALRETVRRPEESPAILGTAIAARLALALVSWLLAQGALWLIGARDEVRLAVGIASLSFVTDALLSIAVVFQARLAMHYEALISVAAQAIDTVAVLWLISAGAGLYGFVAAPAFSGAVAVALAAAVARRRFRAAVALDWRLLPYLLREAFPVGATLFVAVAYLKMDSIMLGMLATPDDVGQYGTAIKPVEYLLLASAILINTLFPLLARWQATDPQRFRFLHRRGTQALLAFTLPVPVMLALTAEPLIGAVYTAAFLPATPALVLLGGALVFMTMNAWQGFTLLSAGRQRVTLLYDLAGLALNVALNAVLIMLMGFIGAALATLATSVFVWLLSSFSVGRLLGAWPDFTSLGTVALANAGLGMTLWALLLLGLPWFAAAALAGLSYPGWLLVCRVTTREELRLLTPARRTALDGVSFTAEAG